MRIAKWFIVGMVVMAGLLASGCFGPGTFRVGVDIQPGTYRAAMPTSGGCYWARLSGFDGTLEEIIANNSSDNLLPDVVTISPTDVGFSSERCGIWTLNLSPITSEPTAPFGGGKFIVGTDIAPGMWRNNDFSGNCYWERLSAFSGTFEDIIAFEYSSSPQIVTIAQEDVGFTSHGCGMWIKEESGLGAAPMPSNQAQIGDLLLTVNGARRYHDKLFPAEPGTYYVAVDITAVNTGNTTRSLNKFSFHLKDSDKYVTGPALTGGPEPLIGAHDMVPGQEVRGFLVFKLCDGRDPVELQYQGNHTGVVPVTLE